MLRWLWTAVACSLYWGKVSSLFAGFPCLHVDVVENAVDAFFFFAKDWLAVGSSRVGLATAFSLCTSEQVVALGKGRWLETAWWSHTEVLCAEVRLQLFEQDKYKGDFVLLRQLFNRRCFDLVQIQVKVFFWLQDVGCLVEEILEELCQKESSSLVLLPRLAELLLQLIVFVLKLFVFLLLGMQVLLVLL